MERFDSNGRISVSSGIPLWDICAEINKTRIEETRKADTGRSFFEKNQKEEDNPKKVSRHMAGSDRGWRGLFKCVLKPFRICGHHYVNTSLSSTERVSDHYSACYW